MFLFGVRKTARKLCESIKIICMLAVLLCNLSLTKAESAADNCSNLVQKPLDIERSPGVILNEIRDMLSESDCETLKRLSQHPDDSTSVFAAWEIAVQQCLSAHASEQQTLPRQQVSRNMAWFLGFLEGRLEILAPTWWRQSLQQTRLELEVDRKTGEGIFIGLSLEYPETVLVQVTPRILVNSSTQAAMVDGLLHVKKKGLAFSIPKALFDAIDNGQEIPGKVVLLAKRCDDRSVILVVHGLQLGDPFLISRISLNSDKVLWNRKIRVAVKQMGGLSGPGPWHRISIHIASDRVVLFGAATTGFFTTSFAKHDGVRNFAFFSSE